MIPSLERWPSKAKEAPSPHEVRLTPLDTNPVFLCLREVTLLQITLFLFGILTLADFLCASKVYKDNLVYIQAAIHIVLYGYLSIKLALRVFGRNIIL